MKLYIQITLGFVSLAFVFLAGCSLNRWSIDQFVAQVATADHLVARDSEWGALLVITGQDATNLMHALGAAEGLSKSVSAATQPHCSIDFMQGTNVLGTIDVQEQWFAAGDAEFLEKSGALVALQRRLESDPAGQRAWVDEWGHDLLRTPQFPAVSNWSGDILRRYAAGDFKGGNFDADVSGVPIPEDQIPDWLRAARAYIHIDPERKPDGVLLDWRHYGLIIGLTNQPITFRASYLANLAPAVVAYHTKE